MLPFLAAVGYVLRGGVLRTGVESSVVFFSDGLGARRVSSSASAVICLCCECIPAAMLREFPVNDDLLASSVGLVTPSRPS